MKRKDLLKKLGYEIPKEAQIKVFIDTDAKNEADDQYAIMHFLMSPTINIIGIGAEHFEVKAKNGNSMQESYDEIKKILKLASVDDVSVYKGARLPLNSEKEESEAVNCIIEAAKKEHIYVAALGALTNLANAIIKESKISSNITVVLNGGGPYPKGRAEFNIMQDLTAARIVFNSNAEIWQIPQNVYSTLEVSIASLKEKVYPCGKIGQYLFDQLVQCNLREFNSRFLLRTGENWTLGDNATIGVLLMNHLRDNFEIRNALELNDDGTYGKFINKKIKVYKSIDSRFILNDFYSKLKLIYGGD